MSRKFSFLVSCLLLTLTTAGCVERRYVILTDPPGAIVFENDRYVGPAPVTRPFLYYGTYRFTLHADGYQTAQVDECLRAPWYEYFPLDFITENLLPWTIRDVRELHYRLEPLQIQAPEQVLGRSQELRQQGQSIGTSPTVPIPAAVPTFAPGQLAPNPATIPPP